MLSLKMITIRYIRHDCFIVSSESASIVFDYWTDTDGENRKFPYFLNDLDPEKPLYVLVSHFHKDHYNPAIFSWNLKFQHIRYIVSLDVWKRMRHIASRTSVYGGPKVDPSKVIVLKASAPTHNNTEKKPSASPHKDHYKDGIVSISAYPSTDAGNSYMIQLDNRSFFHAGDLNAWVWKDESTEEEVSRAIAEFMQCIVEIKPKDIDYCFFPVDSRIGRDYWEGAAIFVRKFRVAHFFPMHFAWGDEKEQNQRRRDAMDFDAYSNKEFGEYVYFSGPGIIYSENNS